MERNGLVLRASFIALSSIGIATMVNAPGLGYGYGLVILVMILASWMFDPLEAFIYMLVSHTIATLIAVKTQSAFLIIFALSNVLRPLLAALGSYLKEKYDLIKSALALVALDSLIALTIAVSYYGDDGIHAAFSVYEFAWIPFAYAIYRSALRGGGLQALILALLLPLTYMISISAFLSIAPLIAAIAVLLYLIRAKGAIDAKRYLAATLILLAGLALGGAPLEMNAKALFYPFNPASWSDSRWSTDNGTCGKMENVFEGVYDPSRLRIVDDCVTFIGKVDGLPIRFDDGDYCFDIETLNSTYPISLGGLILRRGHIHVEIIPRDQKRILGGVGGGLCPGDIVKVTGVYVIDTDHGLWSEVHPVFRIEIVERTTQYPQCIWKYVQEKAAEYSASP